MPKREKAETIVLDSYVPNYRRRCCACDARPTCEGMRAGRQIRLADLCGPCTFGTARALEPSMWDRLHDED